MVNETRTAENNISHFLILTRRKGTVHIRSKLPKIADLLKEINIQEKKLENYQNKR